MRGDATDKCAPPPVSFTHSPLLLFVVSKEGDAILVAESSLGTARMRGAVTASLQCRGGGDEGRSEPRLVHQLALNTLACCVAKAAGMVLSQPAV